jgi:hypothetical protein
VFIFLFLRSQKNTMIRKVLKIVAVVALIALVIIQFIRPEKNVGDYSDIAAFEAETKPSKEVKAILKNNCYDCHSNSTVYPWYAEIAPFSFFLADHVEEGKEHLDLANWESYSLKKKDHKLDELIEEVEEGEMPLESYTLIHGNLSQEEKELLETWAKSVRSELQSQM